MASKSKFGYPHLDKTSSLTQSFFVEFIGTFYLVLAYCACSNNRKASSAVCSAIVALSLFVGMLTFGSKTGGAFNPARTFGLTIIEG